MKPLISILLPVPTPASGKIFLPFNIGKSPFFLSPRIVILDLSIISVSKYSPAFTKTVSPSSAISITSWILCPVLTINLFPTLSIFISSGSKLSIFSPAISKD